MITQRVRQSPSLLLTEALGKVQTFYQRLSFRERISLVLMVVVLAAVVVYKISLVVVEQFEDQARRLAAVESMREALPYRLADYTQLKARKDNIEKAYQKIQISEGMLTYLETLLNQKKAIQRPFFIDDGEPRKFGGKYEQMPFLVKFGITDYGELVELLKELTQGEKPMIVKSINIAKIGNGRQLQVQLDLTGVRRVEAGAGEISN